MDVTRTQETKDVVGERRQIKVGMVNISDRKSVV
jgi:hypothetical protein